MKKLFFLTILSIFLPSVAHGATAIYRSVGPSNTSTLDDDDSGADELDISGSTATFEEDVPDNVGVGDVILYDSNDSGTLTSDDSIVFIHGRTDSQNFTVKNEDGTAPTNEVTSEVTWEIYRAYTSLANAEAGTENSTLDTYGFTYTGGDRDLVTNNEQWNIACYGDAIDTLSSSLILNGWDTGEQTYLRVFTPVETSHVGVSQRHNGTKDSGYKLVIAGNYGVDILINYFRFEGIEYVNTNTSTSIRSAMRQQAVTGSIDLRVTDCYIHDLDNSNDNGVPGIVIQDEDGPVIIANNIIVGNGSANAIEIAGQPAAARMFYNNTIVNFGTGIFISNTQVSQYAKNNIIYSCTDPFRGNFGAGSDYNATDGSDNAGGSNDREDQTFTFVDEAVSDYHLSPDDTAAIDLGTDLSSDSYFVMTDDIDGHLRTDWDIGADEASIEFDPTVMESGGDYSTLALWETGVQTDLVADTTRVFSHDGITGSIADTDTVTGVTSSATADVVHATDNGSGDQEILLENISGTFESGEQVQVDGSNHVTLSNAGNPAIAVAKIDGAWTGAETNVITLGGWTTGFNNYIKIYTTPSARHNGSWNTSAYRIVNDGYDASMYAQDSQIGGQNNRIIIDGLQIENTRMTSETASGAGILFEGHEYQEYSNNIIRQTGDRAGSWTAGISSFGGNFKSYNNIIYDFYYGIRPGVYDDGTVVSIYNNTIHNAGEDGIYTVEYVSDTVFNIKNNLIQDSTTEDYDINGGDTTNYFNNISSDGSAPGSGSFTNHDVEFVDADNDDFHLAGSEIYAIANGVDLSEDTNLNFTDDIDGDTRNDSWDIGADQTATKIFRSVGPSATSAIEDDSSGNNTMTLSGTTVAFASALADQVGVGDAIVYDSDDDDDIDGDDSIVFIKKRTSNTQYEVQASDGSDPSDNVTDEDDWEIYRAYTSLYDAEAGDENDSLHDGLESFESWADGKDLITSNEQWNIACYANGTTADTSAVEINGWTTGEKNYVKVYTPILSGEVGESQRHEGIWDNTKYHRYVNSGAGNSLSLGDNHIMINGIQQETYDQWSATGIRLNAGGLRVSNNIIRRTGTVAGQGVFFSSEGTGLNQYVYNNIVYDWAIGIFHSAQDQTSYIYNNTVFGNTTGIDGHWQNTLLLRNNLVSDNTTDYVDTFHANSEYNLSSDTTAPGSNAVTSANVLFKDESSDNFHLSGSDTSAMNQGTDLSSDSDLPFSDDIDGEGRPYGAPPAGGWDIGADEATNVNVRIRGGVQIDGGVNINKN